MTKESIEISSEIFIDKDDGEWTLYLITRELENEGLAEKYTDPEEVLNLAEELEKGAAELRARRHEDPVRCADCSEVLTEETGHYHWYNKRLCRACYVTFAEKLCAEGKITQDQLQKWTSPDVLDQTKIVG